MKWRVFQSIELQYLMKYLKIYAQLAEVQLGFFNKSTVFFGIS